MSKGTIKSGLERAAALGRTARDETLDATKSAGKAVNDAAKATGKVLEAAADHVTDAMEAAGDYVNRKTVAGASRRAIQDLRTKWTDLRDRAATTGGAARNESRKMSERMARGLDEADAKLVVAEGAGADAWQDARSALDGALKKAQETYESALVEYGGKSS